MLGDAVFQLLFFPVWISILISTLLKSIVIIHNFSSHICPYTPIALWNIYWANKEMNWKHLSGLGAVSPCRSLPKELQGTNGSRRQPAAHWRGTELPRENICLFPNREEQKKVCLAGVRSLFTEGATREGDGREVKKTQWHSRRNGWIQREAWKESKAGMQTGEQGKEMVSSEPFDAFPRIRE